MTNTTSSTPTPAQLKLIKSPLRQLVHAVLFYSFNGEATLENIRFKIECKFGEEDLPRSWRIQVRDILKLDPEIEKTDEDTWVLRTQDSSET